MDDPLFKIMFAILGGAGAYLATRAKDFANRYVDRLLTHMDSLLKCERNIHANLDIYTRNSALLDQYIDTLRSHRLIVPLFHAHLPNRDLSLNTLTLDIVNEYEGFTNFTEHVSHSFEQITRQYDEMKTGTLQDIRSMDPPLREQGGPPILAALAESILPSLVSMREVYAQYRQAIVENLALNQVAYEHAAKKLRRTTILSNRQETLPKDLEVLKLARSAAIEEQLRTGDSKNRERRHGV